MDEVSRVMGPTLARAAPVPLSVPGHEAVPLHGSKIVDKGCATIKAPCYVHWSEREKIAVLQIAKAGSSTLRWLFEKTFEDAKSRPCKGLPRDRDTVVGAFFRDPVERFFSGYDEAVYRCVGPKEYKGREDEVPVMIRQDIEGYNNWHKYWEGSKTATQTFHDYVLNGHNVESPFNTHMHQQSSRVAGLDWIDWVGRVSDFTEDWAEFLRFARARRGGRSSLATAAPEEAPIRRENKWRHIFPAKTPANVMKKICEHVDQDLRCLGLQSRWCSY